MKVAFYGRSKKIMLRRDLETRSWAAVLTSKDILKAIIMYVTQGCTLFNIMLVHPSVSRSVRLSVHSAVGLSLLISSHLVKNGSYFDCQPTAAAAPPDFQGRRSWNSFHLYLTFHHRVWKEKSIHWNFCSPWHVWFNFSWWLGHNPSLSYWQLKCASTDIWYTPKRTDDCMYTASGEVTAGIS